MEGVHIKYANGVVSKMKNRRISVCDSSVLDGCAVINIKKLCKTAAEKRGSVVSELDKGRGVKIASFILTHEAAKVMAETLLIYLKDKKGYEGQGI